MARVRRSGGKRSASRTELTKTPPWCSCCAAGLAHEGKTRVETPVKDGSAEIRWDIRSGTLLQANHALSGKLCDFLIRGTRKSDGEYRDVLAELKSKSARASTVVAQLQGGADLLADEVSMVYPVLVHQGIDSMELRVLSRLRVVHRGKKIGIAVKSSPFNAAKVFVGRGNLDSA